MSFNKKHVPRLEDLMDYHVIYGDEYIRSFENADCLIGPPEAVEYIYSNLNRIHGRPDKPDALLMEESIAQLTQVYDKLKAIPNLALACSELKKVINYIKIKQ
jgi:hypothetical protein